jgi:competence protein ComEC
VKGRSRARIRRRLVWWAGTFCIAVGWVPGHVPRPEAVVAAVVLAGALALRLKRWALPIAMLSGGVLGVCAARNSAEIQVPASIATGKKLIDLRGTISGPAHEAGDRVQIDVEIARADSQPAKFTAHLSTKAPCDLVAGMRVQLAAKLFEPPPRENPGSPPFAERYERSGTAFTGTFKCDALQIDGPAPPWAATAARLRKSFRAQVGTIITDGPAGALVRALALGDRQGIDRDLTQAYVRSGLVHTLSVSGLHLAVVAAGLFWVLIRLLARFELVALRVDVKQVAALLAIPGAWVYVYVTGSEPPAVRSGVMATLVLLSYVFGRDSDGATSLAVAAVTYLAYDPSALFDVSFELSFGAVAGLIALTRPLRELVPLSQQTSSRNRFFRFAHRSGDWLVVAVVTTVAATLPTWPIVAVYFHRMVITGSFSNLPGLPVASALTIAAALAALVHAIWPPAAVPFLYVAGWLAQLMNWIARVFSNAPAASYPVPAPSNLTIAAWSVAVVSFLVLARWRRWAAIAVALLVAVVPPLVRIARIPSSRDLQVTFLAVGQGDSEVVRLPGGRSILVDGGGTPGSEFDPGERIVVPALLDSDIFHLDAVALSHPHPDHALGLPSVIRTLGADEIWVGAGNKPGRLLKLLRDAAAASKSTWREVNVATPMWSSNGATVSVLNPPREGVEDLTVNDASVVLEVRYGRVRFLLPGDLEEDGEELVTEAIAHDWTPETLTVLKAPHHGSASSSTAAFIRATAPHHVVFCVGRDNRFNFPRPEVEQRYAEAGCHLHRTDRDGAITFVTDGSALRVESYRDGQPRRTTTRVEPADQD